MRMERMLRKLFFITLVLCIPAGFFIKHEHAIFFWHKIPSIDTIFGFLGAFLLIVGSRILAFLIQRREDFYD